MPGIVPLSWLKLVSEVGTDLSHWKPEKDFTGGLGLRHNNRQSGKRRRRSPRRKTRSAQIFRQAILSLQKSKDCALGDFYRRIKARRGTPVAVVAAARKLAELYWRVMTHGMAYVEKGIAEYNLQRRAQEERYLRKRAARLGFALTPSAA